MLIHVFRLLRYQWSVAEMICGKICVVYNNVLSLTFIVVGWFYLVDMFAGVRSVDDCLHGRQIPESDIRAADRTAICPAWQDVTCQFFIIISLRAPSQPAQTSSWVQCETMFLAVAEWNWPTGLIMNLMFFKNKPAQIYSKTILLNIKIKSVQSSVWWLVWSVVSPVYDKTRPCQ